MSLFYSRHQNSSMKHLTQVTKIFNQLFCQALTTLDGCYRGSHPVYH